MFTPDGSNENSEVTLPRGFFGIAAVFAAKANPLDTEVHFWEVKGLDLESVEHSESLEPKTVFSICLGYTPEKRSFDVIQGFPNTDRCVGFTVNRFGRVTSFHDDLDGQKGDEWVVVNATVPFRVTACSPDDEVAYAQRYVERVAAALSRCGLREAGESGPSMDR
jgi:hypothetical protein